MDCIELVKVKCEGIGLTWAPLVHFTFYSNVGKCLPGSRVNDGQKCTVDEE